MVAQALFRVKPATPMHASGRHLLATVGTAPAGVRTLLHHALVAERTAGLLAEPANLGTGGAQMAMHTRVSAHRRRRRLADRRTIQQQCDVIWIRMLSAHLQAVGDACVTKRGTVLAVVDALIHRGIAGVS